MSDEQNTTVSELMSGLDATAAAADVAKGQTDTEHRNALTRIRKLRIQLLDCRSGLPLTNIPVKGLWISNLDGSDEQEVVKYVWKDKGWDIVKAMPIYEKNGSWFHGTSSITKGKGTQMALLALDPVSLNPGAPSTSFGDQGKTAFLRYLVTRNHIVVSAEDAAKVKLFEGPKILPEHLTTTAGGAKILKGIKDASGKDIPFAAPTDAQCDLVLQEYNTRCYLAAQFFLATLGYFPPDDTAMEDGEVNEDDIGRDGSSAGVWSDDWSKQYKRWQQVRFGRAPASCWDWIKSEDDAKTLLEESRSFVTDDKGCIAVPVPVAKIQAGFKLEIEFKEFAVVAESTAKEEKGTTDILWRTYTPQRLDEIEAGVPFTPSPIGGATGFFAQWVNNQQTARKSNWGWKLNRPNPQETEKTMSRELKTSWVFEIPAFEVTDEEEDFTWLRMQRRHGCFSMFYDGSEFTPEFVLFAMVWCQPAYDTFDDPVVRGDATAAGHDAYVWPNDGQRGWAQEPPDDGTRPTGMHLHIVTQYMDMGGSEPFGGKGYGLYEHDQPSGTHWRGPATASDPHGGHHGIDIHVRINEPFFAVHAGTASYSPSAGALGKMVALKWTDETNTTRTISGGHLSDKSGAMPRFVRAGEQIGLGGRTGNLSATSTQAGHVHLNVGMNGTNFHLLRDVPDPDNRCCIPTNYRTPLLFPCRCETVADAATLSVCNFENNAIANQCWAVNDLACPHMPRTVQLTELTSSAKNTAKRRVQAQLRKLGYTPGTLDADWGTFENNVIVNKAAGAPIRAEDSATAAKLCDVSNGTALKVLGSSAGWYHVEIPANKRTATSGDNGHIAAGDIKEPNTGSTRKAILAFKTAEGLLPDNPTPADKYEADQAFLDRLNTKAPLIPLT